MSGSTTLLNLMKISLKKNNEESEKGSFPEVDVQHLEKLHELRNDLSFLSEKMKTENFEKLPANLHDKTEYALFIKN